MAALPVVAAAALGFVGAQTTSFVLPRATQTPVTAAAHAGVSSEIPAAQHSGYSSALCAGLSVGVAAAAITSRTTRRVRGVTGPGKFRDSTTPAPEVSIIFANEVVEDDMSVDIPNFAGGLVGSESAWGTYQYDPLDLAGQWPEHLPWYREAELKHGRVAMLAMIGIVAQDSFRIPLPELEDPTLTILNSHNSLIYGIGQGPMWWLLTFCALVESQRFKDLGLDFGKLTLENAGDLNFGKQFLPKTEEGILQMKLKELKNGRLAMLAFSGCITQAAFFDKPHFPFFG